METTLTITLGEFEARRLHALAFERGEDVNHYATALLVDMLSLEDELPSIAEGSPEEDAAIREGLADVEAGMCHRFDPDAILRKYGVR